MPNHSYKIEQIPIDDLLLDVENPRHEKVQDQAAALRALLDGIGGEKILRLAQDIAVEGTNPAELPIVVPTSNQGKYTVVEGNRRVACLRLLANPALIDLPSKRSLKKQFEKLSKDPALAKTEQLPCAVFETRDDASHWIELRHTGERGGMGIVRWGASATARFAKGQSWMALKVAEYVREKAGLDASAKHGIDKMSLTNLARLVNDPAVREAIGISPEAGEINSTVPEDQVLKSLKKIVMDVADKSVSVNRIRSKEDRTRYIEDLVASGAIPRSVPHSASEWHLGAGVSASSPRRGRPPVTKRKVVVPGHCVLRIRPKRMNTIYRELKKMDADALPNSAAVMLRVFFELSIEHHIASNRIPSKKDASLETKLLQVAQDLETRGKLSRGEAQAVRVAASSRAKLFSIDTLHAYVHNPLVMPKGPEVRDTWDEMQILFEKIWP